MEQVLSLSARPRTFDGLVGQHKTVQSIRNRWEKKRMPKAWIFFGPLGCGKTTIARILALSLQCKHQQKFGVPCEECRRLKSRFLISELSTATLGTEKLKDILSETAYLAPMGASSYRVYILDEPQGLHANAQRDLLKLLEDTPDTSIFIICTTEPHSILDTVRSRCSAYELRGLNQDEMLKLVSRLLKKLDSDLPADRLVDALVEKGFNYPRWIAQAVERYVIDGGEIDLAVAVDAAQTIDCSALVNATVTGDWQTVLTLLGKVQPQEARPVRLRVLSYLRAALLESADISTRTRVLADAISELASVQNAENLVMHAVLVASLYRVTDLFSRYKLK